MISTRSLSFICLKPTTARASLLNHVQIISACSHRSVGNRTTSTLLRSRWKWPVAALVFSFVIWTGFEYRESIFEAVGAAKSGNPLAFQPFVLKSKEPVSSTSSIFTLVPAAQSLSWDLYDKAWSKGVWSLRIKQPQLQIERAYTPLPPLPGEAEVPNQRELRLLVRQEPYGEVSGYLHKLPIGAQLDLRGPLVEFKIPEDVDEILFIAGGTGIAPALQVAHSLYHKKRDSHSPPKMHVLWANRRREDCMGGVNDSPNESPLWLTRWPFNLTSTKKFSPQEVSSGESSSSPLVRLLQFWKQRQVGQLSIDYFVDEEQNFINEKALKLCLQKLQDDFDKCPIRRKLILISGPDGFVKHLAGPKVWVNGREVQGQLDGLLSRIDHPNWEIWKL